MLCAIIGINMESLVNLYIDYDKVFVSLKLSLLCIYLFSEILKTFLVVTIWWDIQKFKCCFFVKIYLCKGTSCYVYRILKHLKTIAYCSAFMFHWILTSVAIKNKNGIKKWKFSSATTTRSQNHFAIQYLFF